MLIDLNRNDLLNLVKGCEPGYNVFNHPLVMKSGTYHGGFAEQWSWDKLDDLTDDELTDDDLIELYRVCNDETLVIPNEPEEIIPQRIKPDYGECKTVEDYLQVEWTNEVDNRILNDLIKLK